MCEDAQIMNQMSIEVVSGNACLFEIEIKNPFEKRQNFSIAIQDPDLEQGVIEKAELRLVDNAKREWLHWYDLGKCRESSDWDLVNSADNTVRLEGGQSCHVLFRF